MKLTLQGFKAELFKALAHPVRIRLLELLRSGEKTDVSAGTEDFNQELAPQGLSLDCPKEIDGHPAAAMSLTSGKVVAHSDRVLVAA